MRRGVMESTCNAPPTNGGVKGRKCTKGIQVFDNCLCAPCRYDYVEIHDGNSESADLLGKHCSNIAPAPIISSGPSLHIKFVSDYAHQGAGFSLRYEIFKTGKQMLPGLSVTYST